MEKIWKSIICSIALAFLCTLALQAQSNDDNKEVIIIEKVKDEEGNIISKKILRSSNGDLTDAEIEKAIEESRGQIQFGNSMPDFKNFDFGNLGFLNPSESSKPTLGVVLSFESGEAVITDVIPASGAEEADLRENDIIVSVDGMVVNTIEDIKEYISDKKSSDKVLLSVIRDGQSFEKEVELKKNSFNNPFGNIDPSQLQGFGEMFNFENGGMPFNLDSLMRQFGQGGRSEMPFEFNLPNYSDKSIEEEKASLGVFVDETDEGVIISEIMEDSAAEKAKLKVNDRILKIDGTDISSFDDLARMIRAAGKNTRLLITFERNGKTKEAEVLLQ